MTLKLYFPIIPMAVQSVRFRNAGTFIQTYQPKRNQEYKGCIKVMARVQLPSDFKIIDKPIIINKLVYVFPLLKSMSKKLVKYISDGGIYYKETKPDLLDNCSKATLDALTGVIWRDDSQVVHTRDIYKIYGLNPSITIEIDEVSNVV